MLEWGYNIGKGGRNDPTTPWTDTQEDASAIYANQGKDPAEIAYAIDLDRQRAEANSANASRRGDYSGRGRGGAGGGQGGAGGGGGGGKAGNYLYNSRTDSYSVFDGTNWTDKKRSELTPDVLNSQPGWSWDEQERSAQRNSSRLTDYDVMDSAKFDAMDNTQFAYPQYAM
jgi:hypothetical protein